MKSFIRIILCGLLSLGNLGSASKVMNVMELDRSNSAPYVMVGEFWKETGPYKEFSADWRCDIDSENTYYNVHCWYDEDKNGATSGSGYAGFQNVDGEHVIIFSLWGSKEGSPNVEFKKKNARENTFTNEGCGKNVITPYNWKTNTWYSMKVTLGTEGGYTYFDLRVKEQGKDWETITGMHFPKANLSMNGNTSFLEDFACNGKKRAHSLKNIQATTTKGKKLSINQVYLSHGDSKYFEKMNSTLKCTYSAKGDGIISIISSGKQLTNKQEFPLWVSF